MLSHSLGPEPRREGVDGAPTDDERQPQRDQGEAHLLGACGRALGLSLIVGGSAVYAFSTRFRAEGMGKPKDDTAERSDDG